MKTFKELVTELKASTLGSYIKKASKDANDLAYIQGAAGSLNAPFERKKKHQRERGIEKATDKLVKGQVTKEEIEELDELKASTLGSYVKKASVSAANHALWGGAKGDDEENEKVRTRLLTKADKRLKGIAKASDKLSKGQVTKEEIEELDELMVKDSEKAYELKNKIERLKKTHEKHVAALKALPDTVGNSEKRINLGMKIDGLKRNIKKHIEAHKKLAPSEYNSTNENVMKEDINQIDESSHVSKANIEEGTFDYHLKKALDSHEKGDRKRTEYHLNNAKHARFGLSSTEIVRKADKLNQYDKLATEYETKNEELDESINSGDHVTYQGKTYKVFKVDGTTLHVGEKYGDNKYGGSKMLHTSKVEKTSKMSSDDEADRKKKFMSSFEKAQKEKQARTMKKRGMPYTASKIANEETELDEVLTKSTPVGKWIHDFTKSDNPKFAGKSNKERIKMALGAFYGKQKEKNEETVSEERGWEEKEGGHHKKQGGARVAIKKYGSGWESTYYKDGISQDGGTNHQNLNVLKAKANIWLNKNKD